jgi:hypothetical protein
MNDKVQLAIAIQIAHAAGYYIRGSPSCKLQDDGSILLMADHISHRNGNRVSNLKLGVPVGREEDPNIFRISHTHNGLFGLPTKSEEYVVWDFRLIFREDIGTISLISWELGRPGFMIAVEDVPEEDW